MKKIIGNVRVTVVTESLIRLEYSPRRTFNDDRTLFAECRNHETDNVIYTKTSNSHKFKTDYFKLTYIEDGNPFTSENLFAKIGKTKWHYGISDDFKNGRWLKTKLSYKKTGHRIIVSAQPYGKGYDGVPEKRDYVIELPFEKNLKILSGAKELSEDDNGVKIFVSGRNILDKVEVEPEQINLD